MRNSPKRALTVLGVVAFAVALWIVWGASTRVDKPFAGFLLLDNGVVASAGLTTWPATNDGQIFQSRILAYDTIEFESAQRFFLFIESLPIGTAVAYTFAGGDQKISASISTRLFSMSDAMMLFGASLFCAVVFIGIAGTLLYIAPRDPASLGTAVSFGITGVFALTALDLYGPYHFFRIHAVAECFLGAGMFHMALVFPYRRKLAERFRLLIPSAYAGATALGIVTAITIHSPTTYVQTHRIAISAAGASFFVMVVSQLAAYVRPKSYAAQQRVKILAIGTFASVSPAIAVLLFNALTGGRAAENLISWTGAFFPISVGYAVLKADALKVDAILRRTVSYAILTLLVAASYATIIGTIEWIVRGQGDVPRWISVLIFSGFCTFGVLPLRNRVQSWVDRLFFRSVYDFRVIIEDTSEILARLIQLDEIKDRIKEAVSEALQPESIKFVVHNIEEPSSSELKQGLSAADLVIPFQSHNRVVARLYLGRRLSGKFYSGEDRALLQVLANQGAIAIENALALEQLRDLNRNLENRVESRTAELAQTVDELKDTQVQLVQAERLAAVGELAAGIAHEVNNPLNFARNSLRALDVMVGELSDYACALAALDTENTEQFEDQIKNLSEVLRETNAIELADDVKQLVEILGSGLDRTATLVTDLRDFASPKSSTRGPFDLAETIRTTLHLTGSTLRASQIQVQLDIDGESPSALGDRSSMSQVILNIVKNAADALEATENATIEISTTHQTTRGVLQLIISDNGQGIKEELLERVFEPFFTSKDAGKGTGLGLSVCRRSMQEYGGNIWIEPSDAGGTRVLIEIPTAIEDD